MDINELIIYRNLEYQELFQDMRTAAAGRMHSTAQDSWLNWL